MKSKKDTFASLMQDFLYKYDLPVVFNDFLTMTVCVFGFNPITKKSYDEDIYLETIAKYKDDELRHHFPKMLGCLTLEMEERLDSSLGNDVLGDYYQENFSKKHSGQFFTPWHIAEMMAKCLSGDPSKDTLRILDPCCGTGRLLVAGAKHLGRNHNYYAIDIDHTCVKMCALNLFLNGIFHAEVMWADALSPNDFRMSYKLSFLPFGIFRIQEKEKSYLWHAHQHSFTKQKTGPNGSDLTLPSDDDDPIGNGSQLHLF